jgi:hypothetical protein
VDGVVADLFAFDPPPESPQDAVTTATAINTTIAGIERLRLCFGRNESADITGSISLSTKSLLA